MPESDASIAPKPFLGVSAAHWNWARTWGLRLAEFGFIQGLVQLLTATAGLLIVRTMTKHDYALYAIANSMQVTGNALADMGIGIGFRSIGGRVWNDRERFGQLVNTALGLRRQFAAISFAVTLPLSIWMLWRNGASWGLMIGLCLTITAGIIPLLQYTIFVTSLQIHAHYRLIQKLDLGNAVLRLGLIAVLASTRINALLAALVGVIGNWIQMIFTRRWTREQINPGAPPNAEDRREFVRISLKSMANTIFYCFQGQITLLILALAGTVTGVADLTALGRIGMLFAIFSVTFANVLAPRFTRCQEPRQLPRLYLLLAGGMVLALLPLVLLAWLYPTPFLWLLGAKYAGLQSECGWVVTASCISQIGTTMWILNSSKAWIRIQSPGLIPTVLCVQLIAGFCLNLQNFHDVLIFNIITASAPLPVYLLDAISGVQDCRSNK